MLYRAKVAGCSEVHRIHVSEQCEKEVKPLNVSTCWCIKYRVIIKRNEIIVTNFENL